MTTSARNCKASDDLQMAFDAGGQVPRVWFVMAVVVAQAVGTAVAAAALAREPGPFVAGLLLAYGLGCVLGMVVYLGCYVRRIDHHASGEAEDAHVTTLWPGPPLVLGEDDVAMATAHAGRAVGHRGIEVNAPWTTVRVRGRRLPLIVDAQGSWRVAARTGVLARLGAPAMLLPDTSDRARGRRR